MDKEFVAIIGTVSLILIAIGLTASLLFYQENKHRQTMASLGYEQTMVVGSQSPLWKKSGKVAE